MNKKLNANQIYDLMVEQPGSAEGRDVAMEAVNYLDATEVKVLRDRITGSAVPGSPDYKHFQVDFARGYVLGQLGKIAGNDIKAFNLLLKHVVPEEEPDHWVRFWALTGCFYAKLNKLPQICRWLINTYASVDPGNDFKSLLFSHAWMARFSDEKGHEQLLRTAMEVWLKSSSQDERKQRMEACQDALRVLGIVSVPALYPLIVQVLESKEADPRMLFLACQALAGIPAEYKSEAAAASKALVRFLEGAGNTRILLGVREEALKALGNLNDPASEHPLLRELRGGNLNLIKAAAQSLGKILGIETAVTRILSEAAKDSNPHTRKSYSIALRWMSDDGEAVATALDQHMTTGNFEQQENARMLLAEMGGVSALDKLSARAKVVEDYKTMLLGEKDKFQKLFDSTMLEARQGFKIALSMDVIVFCLGIFLLIASGAAALFSDGSLDNWVGAGMGGVGVLGIIYGTLIANPRKKVFSSVNALMNFKIIFLAYLRQLHQTDQSFTRTILEDEPIDLETLERYFTIIKESLAEAVDNMVILKAQELKEKIEDYKNEVASKALDVKQRIGDVQAGVGKKNREAELEEQIRQLEGDKSTLSESAETLAPPQPEAEDEGDDAGNLSTVVTPVEETGTETQPRDEAEPENVVRSGPKPPPGREVAPGPKPVAGPEVAPGPKPVAGAEVAPGPKPVAAGEVPEAVLEHLKLREGWRTQVYLDSLGKPTAGLGHLLLPAENAQYKVGDRVPDAVLNGWAQKDSKKAYDAALAQAKEAGISSQDFIVVLTSVNFQLGTAWYTIHKNSWALIKAGEYEKAAVEVGNSRWAKQTPVRVKDFQDALRALKKPATTTTSAPATTTTHTVTGMTTAPTPKPPVTPSAGVPEAVIEHLKLREGWRTTVYLDSLGKPTVGLGHLLLPEENAKYKVGDRIPDAILNDWAQKDAKKAYDAAVSQARELNITSTDFINILASVNFQLGTRWYTIHKNTWAYMKAGQYEKAAQEAGNSSWARQTPVRVKDFQEALRALNKSGATTTPNPPSNPSTSNPSSPSIASTSNIITGSVPHEVIEHLKLREGWRTKVYLDSLGKPTVGLGHLMLPEQSAQYKVGDRVPDDVLEKWAEQDSKKAYDAAVAQAKEAGIGSQAFVNALASVNFQLGTRWYTIFKTTWADIKSKNYERAAANLEGTKWNKQTPVRVKDFQEALRAL
ncbi:MAG: hypothetical protein H6581_24320 [Bacteroidia bacterium]|nr:hypothetical protein [Bacteroidia bacterium]